MIDPLTQKYLEVLTEGNKPCAVKGEKNKPGKYAFEGAEKKSPNTTTKNSKISKPTEDKRNSGQSRKGNLEKAKVINSSVNPFEDLYNKILSEDDSFGWEIDKEESETSPFEGDSPNEMEYDSGSSDEEGENEEGGEEGGEEVTLTLDRETAEKLIDILQSAIGGTESEEEEMEDEGEEEMEDEGEEMENEGEEMEDDEELTKEEVESEVLGHSLVDQEKLLKGMDKPGNAIVRGSISAKKKKAQVPLTGKGFKGELSAHGDKGKSLQGKNNKVNAVNAGNKSFFDNK